MPPTVEFPQTRSGTPSPLKSAVATTVHPGTPVSLNQFQPLDAVMTWITRFVPKGKSFVRWPQSSSDSGHRRQLLRDHIRRRARRRWHGLHLICRPGPVRENAASVRRGGRDRHDSGDRPDWRHQRNPQRHAGHRVQPLVAPTEIKPKYRPA
jgi:hypothetical protein